MSSIFKPHPNQTVCVELNTACGNIHLFVSDERTGRVVDRHCSLKLFNEAMDIINLIDHVVAITMINGLVEEM